MNSNQQNPTGMPPSGSGNTVAAQIPVTPGQDSFSNQPIVNVLQQPIINAPVTNVAPVMQTQNADLWEFGGDPTLPNLQPADATILNVYEIRKKQKRPLFRLLVICGLALIAVGVAYIKLETGAWPYEEALVAGFRSHDPSAPIVANTSALGNQKAPKEITKKIEAQPTAPVADGQAPYSFLPNFLTAGNKPVQRGWSKKEEDDYTASMSHKFFYQRYKAVEDVRAQKYSGSEKILFQAVTEKRLWIRMHAIMGIAEFGMIPQNTQVKLAIGNSRKATIANFLKRYERSGLTPGERFALRAVMPYVHDAARLISLKALEKNRDELFGYYLLAARSDQSEKIRDWANTVDMPKGIDPQKLAELKTSMAEGKVVKYTQQTFAVPTVNVQKETMTQPENNKTVVKFYDYEE